MKTPIVFSLKCRDEIDARTMKSILTTEFGPDARIEREPGDGTVCIKPVSYVDVQRAAVSAMRLQSAYQLPVAVEYKGNRALSSDYRTSFELMEGLQ